MLYLLAIAYLLANIVDFVYLGVQTTEQAITQS